MSAVAERSARRSLYDSLAHQARVVRVLAAAEFKLKYRESALGYLWSLLKPLALFSILYVVFGHFFRLKGGLENSPIYLLIGIVLWTFFPRLIVPVSTTAAAAMTFGINLLAVAAFIAWNRIVPQVDWLLIPLLLLELYLFAFGIAIILSTLYVRFRDMAPIWEVVAQVLFYATPIIYPLTLVPYHWVRVLMMLNPFTQVLEDVRALVLYNNPPGTILTATDILGPGGRLYAIAIMLVVFAGGLLLFRRDEPSLAE